jgi:hypothetical protein
MQAGAGMASFTTNMGMGSMQLGQLAGSLLEVVHNLQATRTALDGMAPSFQNFDRARLQAEGPGQGFDQDVRSRRSTSFSVRI